MDAVIVDEAFDARMGKDFVNRLRKLTGRARIPVISLHAMGKSLPSEVHDTVTGLTHLSKPVRLSRLALALAIGLGLDESTTHIRHTENVRDAVDEEPLNCRVLLAEDNPVNQEVAATMLAEFGCQVEVVENGREAVKAFMEASYDVILMDCQMPIMDGYEATQALRQLEMEVTDTARTPIIALTANAMEDDRGRALSSGMDDFLTKPFTRNQLHGMLARWLSGEAPAMALSEEKEADSTKPVVDFSALDELKSLSPGVLEKIIDKYLTTTTALLKSLEDSAQENDLTAVERAAHSLKSSSASLGAAKLAARCQAIEESARLGDRASVSKLVTHVRADYDAAAEALQDLPIEKSA